MDVKYGGWLRFALADWRFLRFKKGKLSGADDGLSFGFYFGRSSTEPKYASSGSRLMADSVCFGWRNDILVCSKFDGRVRYQCHTFFARVEISTISGISSSSACDGILRQLVEERPHES